MIILRLLLEVLEDKMISGGGEGLDGKRREREREIGREGGRF